MADDLYICDSSGSRNYDFLGDVRIDALLPSGNGNSSAFTGSDGNSTDNYALVDESAPNSDTDYVESSNVSDVDTYAFPDLSHSPVSIAAVQICATAKKSDAGARSLACVTRSNSTDTAGATQSLSTSYACMLEVVESDVTAGSPLDWQTANLNAAQFGVKVAA